MASLPERRDEALKVYVYGQHDASGAEPVDITSMDNVLVEIDQFRHSGIVARLASLSTSPINGITDSMHLSADTLLAATHRV